MKLLIYDMEKMAIYLFFSFSICAVFHILASFATPDFIFNLYVTNKMHLRGASCCFSLFFSSSSRRRAAQRYNVELQTAALNGL